MDTDDVVKMPSEKVLRSLAKKVEEIKAKASALNGDAGERVSEAVDKHNVHAAAFKMCMRLMRMDAVKLMSFLTHFDDYREKFGIDKLMADDLPGFDDDDDEEEAAPEVAAPGSVAEPDVPAVETLQ